MPLHLRSRWAATRARISAALPSLPRPVRRALDGMGNVLRRILGVPAALLEPLRRRRARRRARYTYRDDVVRLDGQGLVIRNYYWPVGRKRIAFDAIEDFQTFPLTGMARYRVHGWSYPRRWYHRDTTRSSKEIAIELDTGGWVRPVVTPNRPSAVIELICEFGDRSGGSNRAAAGRHS